MIPAVLIERFPIFSFIKPDKLKIIAEFSNLENIEKGSVVFHEKEHADWLYILLEGHVELFFTVEVEYRPELHKELLFGEVVPGEVFGISALVEPHILTSTARATEPSQVIKISAAGLQDLCEKDDQLAYGFMKQVAKATVKRLNATQAQLARAWDKVENDTKLEVAP